MLYGPIVDLPLLHHYVDLIPVSKPKLIIANWTIYVGNFHKGCITFMYSQQLSPQLFYLAPQISLLHLMPSHQPSIPSVIFPLLLHLISRFGYLHLLWISESVGCNFFLDNFVTNTCISTRLYYSVLHTLPKFL